MAFFEEFKSRAAELAQAGVAKSKVLAEIAKLKAANLTEKETIHKAYLEMGRIYYAEHRSNPDAAYAASCQRVTAAKEAIRANDARIAELKDCDGDATVTDAEPTTEPSAGTIELSSADFEVEDTSTEDM